MAHTVLCPACGSEDVAGVVLLAVIHDILYWQCIDCDLQWHRFSPEVDPKMHQLAVVHMELTAP